MSEIEILEKTYFDKANIIRKVKEKNKNTGVTELIDKVIYSNIKCAISKGSTSINIGDVANTSNSTRLYCNPNYLIETGDKVKVTFENGLESEFITSKPFFYKSHCQCELIEKERI